MVHEKIWWKKITKNTKLTKSTTYYAQWNKKLSTEEKKLVGKYSYGNIQSGWWSHAYNSGGFSYEKYNDGSGALNGLNLTEHLSHMRFISENLILVDVAILQQLPSGISLLKA